MQTLNLYVLILGLAILVLVGLHAMLRGERKPEQQKPMTARQPEAPRPRSNGVGTSVLPVSPGIIASEDRPKLPPVPDNPTEHRRPGRALPPLPPPVHPRHRAH
jgi:hypothetical protein